MYYQIDDIVGFNPEDGTLWSLLEPGELVTIPRLASMLLELLIINNQKSLSRDFFMNELWESKGLVSSGNNLNNYISIIRRTLSTLGIDDIIKTIPKHGFSFEAKHIQRFDEEHRSVDEEIKIEETPIPLNPKVPVNKKKIAIVLLIVIAVISLAVYWQQKKEHEFSKTVRLGKIENCNIMVVWNGQSNDYGLDTVQNSLNKLAASHFIDCKRKSTLYYYKANPAKTPRVIEKRMMIAQCPEVLDNNVVCKSYLFNETNYG
ncbi:winged helix-turn-helix domain-containing protein [Pragia fontium]|uniref:winged helix-turn-helix domain-containing protein n=1 Tax=Pragia fontium TaxID=82985 RepID=UPI00064B52BF|nr:winged helix-turn-helix domain-containing protein [Pragia fontium]AKJ41241.1 hypothetical protein QQ39_03385 [Pragia fontium]